MNRLSLVCALGLMSVGLSVGEICVANQSSGNLTTLIESQARNFEEILGRESKNASLEYRHVSVLRYLQTLTGETITQIKERPISTSTSRSIETLLQNLMTSEGIFQAISSDINKDILDRINAKTAEMVEIYGLLEVHVYGRRLEFTLDRINRAAIDLRDTLPRGQFVLPANWEERVTDAMSIVREGDRPNAFTVMDDFVRMVTSQIYPQLVPLHRQRDSVILAKVADLQGAAEIYKVIAQHHNRIGAPR